MDQGHAPDRSPPGTVTDWAWLPVSHCQYEVFTAPHGVGTGIYVLGDDLLHVGGASHLTGFCGIHTGRIQLRVRVLADAPVEVDGGWDAISEATLWSPSGSLWVVGLMGGVAEELSGVAVPRGLIRVRVHARHRLHETVRTDDDPAERHELHVWSVSEQTPWRTVLADPAGRHWEQKPAKAAEWAMLSLVPRPTTRRVPHPPRSTDPTDDDADLPRVSVVRPLPASAGLTDAVLPAGDLEVRLERLDDESFRWSWAVADVPIFPEPLTTLPDGEPSTVRLRFGADGGTLRHEGVLGRHAFALGLIWDHLLDTVGSYPWVEPLRRQATEATARAEQTRHRQAAWDAAQWGGSAPSDRVRRLSGQARSLALVDRPLLDRLEASPPAAQRAAACWAARRAMRVAGLESIGWIADALADAEAGRPLPDPFTERYGAAAFDRLLSDPEVPRTTVTLYLAPQAHPVPEPVRVAGAAPVDEALQQAVAFPALIALADDDPLAAAVDAVWNAAIAHGDDRDRFLAEAHEAVR